MFFIHFLKIFPTTQIADKFSFDIVQDMTSIQFLLQPLPGTDEQFTEKLREVSDKSNKIGFDSHRIFDELTTPVKEVVIGPSHIGVLLENGKAFRVAFSINTERLDLSKNDLSKNITNSASTAGNNLKSSNTSSRQLARSRARLMRTTNRSSSTTQSSASRSTGVIIGGTSNRTLLSVPSTYVPEELISQAEVVLQGKSRNLIVRELQRTNLDVNLAVNNLLSRDDDDAEEADDAEDGADNYVPEDLISLLDNGFHADNNSVIVDPSDGLFTEEVFSNYSSIRNLLFDRIRNERNQSAGAAAGENVSSRISASGNINIGQSSIPAQLPSITAERESFSRWRDRQCYVPRRWLNKDEYVWEKETSNKKLESSSLPSTSPVWISDEIQTWPTSNEVHFKTIASLYSEFIAVTKSGELHQWRWADIEPHRSETENIYHPKTVSLNLANEKIERISASFVRCSVVTETNKIATWIDEQLGYIGAKLEHVATLFPDFVMDRIISINVCSLYTAVRSENDFIYWWGVLPFEQRCYLWDKFRTKCKKPSKNISSDITVGTQVIMKKCPKYQAGSIGFICANGVPKVGQLLNSVWDSNDICRFKIITVSPTPVLEKTVVQSNSVNDRVEINKHVSNQSKSTLLQKESTDRIDMPPPPSPASSTCSDTSSVTSHKRSKRMLPKDEQTDMKKDEELWQLKDVVFVEDKVGPIGKVLKVDGDFLAVRFPILTSSNTTSQMCLEIKDDDWQQCRLLRRDDVQIYKNSAATKSLEWLQKVPKRINICQGNESCSLQLLSMAVDLRGIHVLKKVLSKIHYCLYNLHNSKQEQHYVFSTDSSSFLGSSIANISMHTCNDGNDGSASTIIVIDGNNSLYPLSRDCLGSLKDPHWFNLPPIKTIALNTISIGNAPNNNNQKSNLCMTALIFQTQKLMTHILRCDITNALSTLHRLERKKGNVEGDIASVIEEKCDGSRNIFHACAVMCSPTTNKEYTEKRSPIIGGTPIASRCASVADTESENVAAANVSSSSYAATAFNTTGSSNFSSEPSGSANTNREGRSVSLREMMNRLIHSDAEQHGTPTSSLPVINSASNNDSYNMEEPSACIASWTIDNTQICGRSIDIESFCGKADESLKVIEPTNYVFDPLQRQENAIRILQHMCSNAALRPALTNLLSNKDAQGQTPFMLAINSRAYEAGLILLDTILNLAGDDQLIKESMIFPAGCPLDQSPLYVICYNDTCSFTWTGADHINQNIFECKTCGLTDSLCCCTECARVCHKGHDCKLKRTSPTAYCDCWEKCKCKALIAGNQNKRYELLQKLTNCTDLVSKFNEKGESILLFLIQTVGRQAVEQRQYRASSRARNVSSCSASGNVSSGNRKLSNNNDIDGNTPEHGLEPPKFVRRALEHLLVDWSAVRSMVMTGAERITTNNNDEKLHRKIYQSQKGSTMLDKFTHNLLVKCSGDHLDILLMTFVRELQNTTVSGRKEEAELVAQRFVRSVVRVFVIFNLEKFPNPERRKFYSVPHKHLQSCCKVFQILHKYAIVELCETAEAIISPVRLGIVRPTAPFLSSSNFETSDDIFNVEPLAPSVNLEPDIETAVIYQEPSNHNSGYNFKQAYGVDSMDTSEVEEISNRDASGMHNSEDDLMDGNNRNEEVGIQDEESDTEYTFNDPDTDSDSDDNQSQHDIQSNTQGGRIRTGSDTDIGVSYLDDESVESSLQDEASENGDSEENEDEQQFSSNQQLERQSVSNASSRNATPQSMQWAMRSRDSNRSSMRVTTGGSSLVFIDPIALRRSTVPTNTTVSAATTQEQYTMTSTCSNLARAFGIIVRQISEILNNLTNNFVHKVALSLKISYEETAEIQTYLEKRLKPTWDWMFSVLDSTEAQLKFGTYLTNSTDPSHPHHPLNFNTSQQNSSTLSSSGNNGSNSPVGSSRRDFLTYCLSLMRAHTSEHRDALPVLDITALRHIAYVLDSFIYYLRNDTNFYESLDTIPGFSSAEDTDEEMLYNISNESGNISFFKTISTGPIIKKKKSFFNRSDSTLSLGCVAQDGFDLPVDVSLPLADKPHLLQPNSKRQELFANVQLTEQNSVAETRNVCDLPQTKLSFTVYGSQRNEPTAESNTEMQHDTQNVAEKFLGVGESNLNNLYLQLKKKKQDAKLVCDFDTEHQYSNIPTSGATTPVTAKRAVVIVTPPKKNVCNESISDAVPINVQPGCSKTSSSSAGHSVIVRAGTNSIAFISETNNETERKCDPKQTRTISTENHQVRGIHFSLNLASKLTVPPWNYLLSRWKLVLDLFGRVFMDDVGMEHGSILPELRGFPVKEMRFRRHMEKLRNGQQRDLILSKLERNHDSLIIQTFKELNNQFGTHGRRIHPPLTFNRIKVTFKDEPGEGSGVARSFYTSISEALLSTAKIPCLDFIQTTPGNNNKHGGVPFSSIVKNRTPSYRDVTTLQKRGIGSKILWRTARERKVLNYDARPYISISNKTDTDGGSNPNDHLSIHLQQLGERLYSKIFSINASNAAKITGMLLEIPTPQLLSILSSDDILHQKVSEALELISMRQKADVTGAQKKMNPVVLLEPCHVDDNEPLFYMPGKVGFYTPRQGYGSFERINAFRNVGRLIGLCLLQNELLPLYLQRHVLKYILSRKIKFHDLAFFDTIIYESLRQLISNCDKETEGIEGGNIKEMELFYVIDLMKEEGGGSVELIPGGRDIQVTSANILDYIQRYTEYRLIKVQEKALEALRDGVFDVLPENSLQNLTSEDLRLLLNGVGNINVMTLISYTSFNDESSEGADKLIKFKRWFWSIVEKMSTIERQDLVYFWTGSPSLPASEEGFQPLPSITIRPADDAHLPTANTCISRLYIPLYSTKSILRNKLLLAIKSKTFGFV